MDINKVLRQASDAQVRTILEKFLHAYLNPAFGSLPKGEVELLVLSLLQELNAISAQPEVYELVSSLRVTRSKARTLIYNSELRSSSVTELDGRIKELLSRPLVQKQGDLFVLEVENPLLADHLRNKVQKLGYISDGSFSPNLIKLGLDAVSALIESYLSDSEKKQVKKILVKAGAPDTSFRGVIKAALKRVAARVADEAGEAVIDKASGYLSPLLAAAGDVLAERMEELFAEER